VPVVSGFLKEGINLTFFQYDGNCIIIKYISYGLHLRKDKASGRSLNIDRGYQNNDISMTDKVTKQCGIFV
jgi:hypothetical protein